MKATCIAGWSWVPNTFPRTYLNLRLSIGLILLCMDSNLIPGPINHE